MNEWMNGCPSSLSASLLDFQRNKILSQISINRLWRRRRRKKQIPWILWENKRRMKKKEGENLEYRIENKNDEGEKNVSNEKLEIQDPESGFLIRRFFDPTHIFSLISILTKSQRDGGGGNFSEISSTDDDDDEVLELGKKWKQKFETNKINWPWHWHIVKTKQNIIYFLGQNQEEKKVIRFLGLFLIITIIDLTIIITIIVIISPSATYHPQQKSNPRLFYFFFVVIRMLCCLHTNVLHGEKKAKDLRREGEK